MRMGFLIIFLIATVNKSAHSQNKVDLPNSFNHPVMQELKPFYPISEREIKSLLKGEVISEGNVTSPTPKQQQLILFVSGIHPRSCTRVMRKLSRYEDYHQYINFIKQSAFDDKGQQFSFTIDHILLPYPMLVKFKIPRIKQDGHYPFTFEDGFLKGLKGTVIVKSIGKSCLLGLKSDWRGPETKLPDVLFGTFLQTVGKLGLEHLIRVSLF